jgi:hypothetical protein
MGVLRAEDEPRETDEQVKTRFGIAQDSARPDADALDVQVSVREAITTAGLLINANVEDGREKSLALTHLEEALLWTGKGLFR